MRSSVAWLVAVVPRFVVTLTCGIRVSLRRFAQNVFVAGRYDGSQAPSHAVDSPSVSLCISSSSPPVTSLSSQRQTYLSPSLIVLIPYFFGHTLATLQTQISALSFQVRACTYERETLQRCLVYNSSCSG